MKEGLKTSLSVGAFLTVSLYVIGFIWQYSYLGSITNDLNWIKIVTSDYIYLGVMAVLFVLETWQLVTLVIVLGLVLSRLLVRAVPNIWGGMAFKLKIKFHTVFYWLNVFFSGDSSGRILIAYFTLVAFSLSLSLKTPGVAAQHMASRLSSDGVDTVCNKKDECYRGKVLYIGDKQIYFYSFEGKEKVTDGALKLVSISDWTVTMAWYEKSRDVINQYIEQDD